jgi:FixJ family two-component response regulator
MVAKKQIGVAVIAADFTVRDSFRFLLETHGYRAKNYQSDESFVAGPLSPLSCIVVDRSDRRCYRLRLFPPRRLRRTSATGV